MKTSARPLNRAEVFPSQIPRLRSAETCSTIYVETGDTCEKTDMVKFNAKIGEIIAGKQILRNEIDRIIAKIEVEA